MEISIKKGLNIPLAGEPSGKVQNLPPSKEIALSLDVFKEIKFKVLAKVGDVVSIGQPLVENKLIPGQFFISPAAGTIREIRRGLKRQLSVIVIDVAENEQNYKQPSLSNHATKEEILTWLNTTGMFPFIRMRPFNLLADPKFLPKTIFVKALESAPFTPRAELQVVGNEIYFQKGIDILAKIAPVNLIHHKKSDCQAFLQAKNVLIHSASGPHPIANPSVHIHHLDQILNVKKIIWTIDVLGVIAIGKMADCGKLHYQRVISIAGNGILPNKRGFFNSRMGCSIKTLVSERVQNEYVRFISGNPLTGSKVNEDQFLNFYDTAFCSIPENTSQEFLHFFRLGLKKYTATKAYLSGHFSLPAGGYEFTTNQHGEERAFIDGSVYDKIMPMRIPTMQLVKAILAEDFELAEQLGLLEVEPEDFALASFICPSKIEMMEIVQNGLTRYSKELGF